MTILYVCGVIILLLLAWFGGILYARPVKIRSADLTLVKDMFEKLQESADMLNNRLEALQEEIDASAHSGVTVGDYLAGKRISQTPKDSLQSQRLGLQ